MTPTTIRPTSLRDGKAYMGERFGPRRAPFITANGEPLPIRRDLLAAMPPVSPDLDRLLPEWGFLSDGPLLLSVSLLADASGNDASAREYGRDFLNLLVQRLPYEGWILSQRDINCTLTDLRDARTTVAEVDAPIIVPIRSELPLGADVRTWRGGAA